MSLDNFLDLLRAVVEIAVLWIAFYRILLFFEGTRAFQVLKGILYLIIALVGSQVLGFEVLNWLLSNFFSFWILVIVVIFAHEIRAGLARLGQQHLFTVSLGEGELDALLNELSDAVFKCSKKKVGCLIAFERETKLTMYIESGIPIDAKLSSTLLQTLFMSTSPMHDGGAILRHDRIVAASCLFPLSDNPMVNKTVGTRHRAALGLSEHTDALVIVVSEETGEVSVGKDGHLKSIPDEQAFMDELKLLLAQPKKVKDE